MLGTTLFRWNAGRPRLRPRLADVILAVALSALVWSPPLLLTAPLAWRRRFPVAVFGTQLAGVAIVGGHLEPDLLAYTALLVGAYSVAAYQPARWVSLAVVLAAAGWASFAFGDATPDIPGPLTPFALVLPVWSMADQARLWRERATRLERERDVAASEAIAQERARIARELHDVLTHNVSVMVIQAAAAQQMVGVQPELARGAMAAVERVGQEAMGELRHLLNLIGDGGADGDDGEAAPPRPQPGLDQLDTLVSGVRAAGVAITAERTGPVHPLASAVSLTGYRVVQEALTNVLRHAPGASAVVRIEYAGSELLIEVTNGPPTAVAASQPVAGGRGLIGLAERVHLHHGGLTAGPSADGGYRVYARIPCEPAR